MLNARQIAYLQSLGLPQGASDVQVNAFVGSLGAGQAKFLEALAAWTDTPEGTGDRGPGTGTAAATPAVQPVAAVPQPPAAEQPVAAVPQMPDLVSQVQAAARAERSRCAHAQAVARQLGLGDQWAAAQIDGNFSVEQINGAAVSQAAANRPPISFGHDAQVGTDRHGLAVGQALVDALLCRAGTPLLEVDPSTAMPTPGRIRAAHPLAGRFRGNASMLAATYLQLCGRDIIGMSAVELARAVFVGCPKVNFLASSGGMLTTSDFPLLLANAAGMSMQTRYALAPTQWRIFATEAPAANFLTQTLLKVGSLPILPEVKEGGEYTYVNFGEDAETWALVKRGHILALSWEMILNDQLGAFNRAIEMEGDAAARTDDTLAFAVITANAAMRDTGALFNATAVTTAGGHANYVAHGSGAAPSVITLNAARAAMAVQSAPPKNLADTRVPLNIQMGVLIVPVALKGTAQVLNRAQYDPAAVAGTLTPNTWQGAFGQGPAEKIASHALLDAADPVAWYVCTDPAVQPAMILGYLDGYRGPQMTQESGFDTDVRKFKVSHARVAKATDWRLWYGNNGN